MRTRWYAKIVAAIATSMIIFAASAQTPPPEPVEKPDTKDLQIKPGLRTDIPPALNSSIAKEDEEDEQDDESESSRRTIQVAPRRNLSTEELLRSRRNIPSIRPGATGNATDTRDQALEPEEPATFAQGEIQYSAISGSISGNTKILDLSNRFMSSIFWREANNKPCYFQIDALGYEGSSEVWSPCSGVGFAAVFDTGARVSLEENTAIGRLQVCHSRSGRIKGIRVYGDRINPDGTTTYHPAISTSEFPNCRDWKQDVLCPTGTLSSGLVIHYDSGGSRPAATGLQLACRGVGVRAGASTDTSEPFAPLVVKPIPIPLVVDTSGNQGQNDKSDKGNEVMETTPSVGFADGNPNWTGVSGRTGQTRSIIDFEERALNSIGWREKFDKACEINLYSRLEGDLLWAQKVVRCAKNDSSNCVDQICKAAGIGANQTHAVRLVGVRTAITALRVCTNDRSNGRVKGIEIKGGEILDDATMSNIIMTNRDTLNHCRKWETLQKCGVNQAATGVQLHFDRGKGANPNTDQLVGIQLGCRKLELQ